MLGSRVGFLPSRVLEVKVEHQAPVERPHLGVDSITVFAGMFNA